MVVFTCNHCGESLQKPRVEKHYNIQCRRAKSLTCVDCFKDFRNEEYSIHTKCVTEEERYAAKGSFSGGIVKKGEVKQASWLELIEAIVQRENNLKPSVCNLLNIIGRRANVPRKKTKFMNFVKSSSGGRANVEDAEAVWNLIEKYKIEQKASGDGTNQDSDVNSNRRKSKHKSAQEDDNVPANKRQRREAEQTEAEKATKFSFKNAILNILGARGSVSSKKLQKKVLNLYLNDTGASEYTEKVIKKYNKKLTKLTNVVIKDDVVSLNDDHEV